MEWLGGAGAVAGSVAWLLRWLFRRPKPRGGGGDFKPIGVYVRGDQTNFRMTINVYNTPLDKPAPQGRTETEVALLRWLAAHGKAIYEANRNTPGAGWLCSRADPEARFGVFEVVINRLILDGFIEKESEDYILSPRYSYGTGDRTGGRRP